MNQALTIPQTIRLADAIRILATDYHIGLTDLNLSELMANVIIGYGPSEAAFLAASFHQGATQSREIEHV